MANFVSISKQKSVASSGLFLQSVMSIHICMMEKCFYISMKLNWPDWNSSSGNIFSCQYKIQLSDCNILLSLASTGSYNGKILLRFYKIEYARSKYKSYPLLSGLHGMVTFFISYYSRWKRFENTENLFKILWKRKCIGSRSWTEFTFSLDVY